MSKLSEWQQKFADGFEAAILKYYKPALGFATRNRFATLMTFIGVFVLILSFIMSGWTRFTFFPRIPSETVRATITMPVGTSFEVVDGYVAKISDAAKQLQEKYRDVNGQSVILNTLATTGGWRGDNQGQVRFEILPAEKNYFGIGSRELVNEWRDLIGPLPGAESVTFRAEFGRGGDPIDVQLSATSMSLLETVAEEVKAYIATYPTAFDIADSMSDGKEEIQIELTDQGYAMGMSISSITSQVRNAFLVLKFNVFNVVGTMSV